MTPAEEVEVGTSLDPLSRPSSLTVRRQAASNLPNFELPPPSNTQFAHTAAQKYPPLFQSHHPKTTSVSVGNLFTTPLSNAASAASASAPPNSPSNRDATGSVLPYTPTFFNTVSKPGLNLGFSPQSWQSTNPLFPPRPVSLPGLGDLMRSSADSANAVKATTLPPPPYDLSALPPLRTSYEDTPPSLPVQSASNHFTRPPYPSYNLPPMPSPVLLNINNLYATMSAVGSFGGLPITTSAGESVQQHAQNDRPFECDSCPQSYNRNHDLKRHKRIHLAVKPFPCKHCDKSFSRRDALKVSSNIIQKISVV